MSERIYKDSGPLWVSFASVQTKSHRFEGLPRVVARREFTCRGCRGLVEGLPRAGRGLVEGLPRAGRGLAEGRGS